MFLYIYLIAVGKIFVTFFFFFFLFFFLGLHPWYMEVPRLGVESVLQLPAYTDWILNPLSRARDQICNPIDTSWVCYH